MVWRRSQIREQAGPSVVAEGIVTTTPIATPDGWRPAGSLVPGSVVLTFDAGPQQVTSAHVMAMGQAYPSHWPLLVPAWALDNRDDLVLLPEQKVLIEADVAEDLYGDPFALISAQSMEGWRGIVRWRPPEGAAVEVLGFARPQVVYASGGVLLSCHGDPFAEGELSEPLHITYSLGQARHLIACLMAEEAGAALREVGQHPLGLGQR